MTVKQSWQRKIEADKRRHEKRTARDDRIDKAISWFVDEFKVAEFDKSIAEFLARGPAYVRKGYEGKTRLTSAPKAAT